jgi:hypothetical protein
VPSSVTGRLRCRENGFGSWLRAGSRPMKLAPDDSQGSPWPSPASRDPAGPVAASRWRSRTGIRGDKLRAAVDVHLVMPDVQVTHGLDGDDRERLMISIRSRSDTVRPALARACRMALDGWECSELSGPATLPCVPISASARPRPVRLPLRTSPRRRHRRSSGTGRAGGILSVPTKGVPVPALCRPMKGCRLHEHRP